MYSLLLQPCTGSVVIQHRGLFPQQPQIDVKLPPVMPMLVVGKSKIPPSRIGAERGFDRTIQLAFRHRREYAVRGLMTRLGVSSQVVDRGQSPDFRRTALIFRAGPAGCLRSELSLTGSRCQDLFLTVHMKNKLARRAHDRLRAEIEVSFAEGVDRSESDAVNHVEVLTLHRESLPVH